MTASGSGPERQLSDRKAGQLPWPVSGLELAARNGKFVVVSGHLSDWNIPGQATKLRFGLRFDRVIPKSSRSTRGPIPATKKEKAPGPELPRRKPKVRGKFTQTWPLWF